MPTANANCQRPVVFSAANAARHHGQVYCWILQVQDQWTRASSSCRTSWQKPGSLPVRSRLAARLSLQAVQQGRHWVSSQAVVIIIIIIINFIIIITWHLPLCVPLDPASVAAPHPLYPSTTPGLRSKPPAAVRL
ncbi:MAG: hypothetical protein ACT6R6_18650 [Flavobacterium sp.]|uniref:hypothetical protein n=1 Tax=Flavobacterium sp. TaxID=239 RepID=UPI004034ADC7